jgi:hypothetical protein
MYRHYDIEDGYDDELLTEQDVMDSIQEWNYSMGTEYKSIDDFNNGEQYYKYLKVEA